MQLVDVEGPVKVAGPLLHPFFIGELVGVQVPDNGGKAGTQLHAEAVGIAVLDPAQLRIDDILVHLPFPGLRHRQLPEAFPCGVAHIQFLPAGELSDQGHLVRIQGKGPEYHALFGLMGAEVFIGEKFIAVVKTLCIKVSVQIRRHIFFLPLQAFLIVTCSA